MSNSTMTTTVINEAPIAKAIKPATLNTYYTGSPTGQMPEYLRERRAFLTEQGRMSVHLGNSELIFAEDNLFVMTQTPEGKKAFSVKDQPQLAGKVFIGLVRAWTLLSRNSVVPETIDGGVRATVDHAAVASIMATLDNVIARSNKAGKVQLLNSEPIGAIKAIHYSGKSGAWRVSMNDGTYAQTNEDSWLHALKALTAEVVALQDIFVAALGDRGELIA